MAQLNYVCNLFNVGFTYLNVINAWYRCVHLRTRQKNHLRKSTTHQEMSILSKYYQAFLRTGKSFSWHSSIRWNHVKSHINMDGLYFGCRIALISGSLGWHAFTDILHMIFAQSCGGRTTIVCDFLTQMYFIGQNRSPGSSWSMLHEWWYFHERTKHVRTLSQTARLLATYGLYFSRANRTLPWYAFHHTQQ